MILQLLETNKNKIHQSIKYRVPSLEWKQEWKSLIVKCNKLFFTWVGLLPWISSEPHNGYHKVSAIYLHPARQSDITFCSPTTIWSNTTSLASLLQKTWWQWKFLCFNKDQSREFTEPLDLLSSMWAHLLHPDHQEVSLILLLTFCLSWIKKLSFLDCIPFCAIS